jgi:hypothetical protein
MRHDTYDPKQRTKLAGDYILRGLGGTRIFDTCFEMHRRGTKDRSRASLWR